MNVYAIKITVSTPSGVIPGGIIGYVAADNEDVAMNFLSTEKGLEMYRNHTGHLDFVDTPEVSYTFELVGEFYTEEFGVAYGNVIAIV